jgi:hypothetical protein
MLCDDDVGLFYDTNELLKMSVSLKFDSVRCKGFCCYQQAHFNRLADNQKQLLFEHHYRNLVITEPIYPYDEMISPISIKSSSTESRYYVLLSVGKWDQINKIVLVSVDKLKLFITSVISYHYYMYIK